MNCSPLTNHDYLLDFLCRNTLNMVLFRNSQNLKLYNLNLITYGSQSSPKGLLLTNCCAIVKKLHHFQSANLASGNIIRRLTQLNHLKVQNDILLSMDRQEVCFLVLLDLSSAFDTIDHKTIIDVLEYQFGVTDKALEWIKLISL